MLSFLKYFCVALLAQVALLASLVAFTLYDASNPMVELIYVPVAAFYIWPAFLVPELANSHGGQLLVVPFVLVFYSLVFAFVVSWRNTSVVRN